MEKEISKKKEEDIGKVKSKGTLIAEIPREGLKSIFHILVGRPDSEELILTRAVKITKDDIFILHDKLMEKLENHHIFSANIKVDVTFENGKTKQFGSWMEFRNFDWITSEVTKEIYYKLDFLVNLPNFEMPQKHAISIRIMSRPNPITLLRSMLSKDPEEVEEIENLAGPIVCRVDFINNILAKEILEIIKEWNNCCKLSFIEKRLIKFIRKYPSVLEYFFRNLTFIIMSLLSVSILLNLTSNIENSANLTFGNVRLIIIWSLLSFLGIGLINQLRKKIFSYTMRSFRKYGNRFLTFELTNGDKEKQDEIILKDSGRIKKFLFGSAVNLLLNVCGGILVYYFLK